MGRQALMHSGVFTPASLGHSQAEHGTLSGQCSASVTNAPVLEVPAEVTWSIGLRSDGMGARLHAGAIKGDSGSKADANHSPQLGRLQPYLAARLDELLRAVEQAAMADFNDWLVGPACALLHPAQHGRLYQGPW